jgi:hypothetical protein
MSKLNRFNINALAVHIAVSSVLLLFIFHLIPICLGDSINPQLFAVDSKPYGSTFGDWSIKWWQWLLSISTQNNPASDQTGKDCAVGQPVKDVWFLAQTTSGSGERTCTVPAGRGILLPLATNECSTAEAPALTTESALRACAVSGNEVNSIVAMVDGVKLKDLQHYRVQSPLFNVTLPENNIPGVPAGTTQAVSDAYMTFLKPLSPGNHTLEFSQVTLDNPTTGTKSFAYSIKYHLIVKP